MALTTLTVPLRDPDRKPKRVSILGSTGSIGRNTVDLVERNPGRYAVEALTANRNVDLLVQQALKLRPRLAVVSDPACYHALKDALAGSGIRAAAGVAGVIEAAALPADWVMAAIVGFAGLQPTLTAIRRGATVALANKECLVSAGTLVMAEVRHAAATLIPVDSEHNAIFQVFDFDQPDRVERLILTASGGPFREATLQAMAAADPAQAIAHPNWSMGAKISVDSATMMNKGLELIEAYHLFPVPEERIEVLVHPQSVVHSMVAYSDGSVLAQMGVPDMRTPIAYALAWPRRMDAPCDRLRLERIGTLTFEAPDAERFPALRLAREALRQGGSAPTILNAANEIAVEAFLGRRVGFLDIAGIAEDTLAAAAGPLATLDDVLAVDGQARDTARRLVARIAARR